MIALYFDPSFTDIIRELTPFLYWPSAMLC